MITLAKYITVLGQVMDSTRNNPSHYLYPATTFIESFAKYADTIETFNKLIKITTNFKT